MSKAILLASGGLDSTTLAFQMLKQNIDVHPIFFDYGQHCAEKEWSTLKEVLPIDCFKAPERINISDIFRFSTSRLIREPDLWSEAVISQDLYIPYRTLLFFSMGAAIAQTRGIEAVFSAFINSNYVKEVDCSTAFFNKLEALSEGIGSVRLILPFRDMNKSDVAQLAARLTVPIGRTFSCQVFSNTPCGACPNCVERIGALKKLGSAK